MSDAAAWRECKERESGPGDGRERRDRAQPDELLIEGAFVDLRTSFNINGWLVWPDGGGYQKKFAIPPTMRWFHFSLVPKFWGAAEKSRKERSQSRDTSKKKELGRLVLVDIALELEIVKDNS